jgi:hypothetical protein
LIVSAGGAASEAGIAQTDIARKAVTHQTKKADRTMWPTSFRGSQVSNEQRFSDAGQLGIVVGFKNVFSKRRSKSHICIKKGANIELKIKTV